MLEQGKQVTVRVEDGAFPLLVACPAVLPAAAVVCVPSIFGINAEARRWLEQYSAAGFLTAVYDPFWRTLPGALDIGDAEQARKARARRDAFKADDGVRDLRGATDAVRALPECNGNVAVAGYCFGGRYALIAAAQLDVQAAVAFHGIRMGDSVADVRPLRCPVSFHFGDDDHSTPMSEVEAIQTALRDDPNAHIYVYPGVGHSYTWRGHRLYDDLAARLSEERALSLLETLR
jgi:carboxymethylenebutenolidase